MDVYIKSSACISALNTFGGSFEGESPSAGNFLACVAPDYKEFINLKLLRRMGPISRNGVTAGISALKRGEIEQPDAIIVGTALGCLKDTESFLRQLITEGEELPNPTAFIQSTHNTIAGQLALLLGCKSYNFTFSQMHRSFETALLDAYLLLAGNEMKNLLVGGVDEINSSIYELIGSLPCYNGKLLGEGAGFFVLSTDESLVRLKGVRMFNGAVNHIVDELRQLNLSVDDIDLVIGGESSPDEPAYTTVKSIFSNSSYMVYKPYFGEFGTVSAIALWLAAQILEGVKIPDNWFLLKNRNSWRNILIYNNIEGEQSIMVLGKE